MSPTGSPIPSSTTATLLSYPAPESDAAAASSSSAPPSKQRELLQERLYVGNLHPTVDEGTLIQIFAKYGKLARLDFLFHKTGPQKGKPRGFAFVEYADASDADRALAAAHGKVLRGRHLVVTHAHQAPPDAGGAHAYRRNVSEAGRPTALSMLKSAGGKDRMKDKIAMMEAKLRQLEKSPPNASVASHRPRPHPSLPAKPPPPSSTNTPPLPVAMKPKSTPPASAPSTSALMRPQVRPAPSLPLVLGAGVSLAGTKKAGGAGLKGVKIVKKKPREQDAEDGGKGS